MSAQSSTDSGWQLQGNAAEAYESFLVPVIFQGLAERLVAAAEIRPGDRVLDVACGTGVVARTAARQVGPEDMVAGVDVNPDMLATARDAARAVTPGIHYRQGDAVDLPFEDGTFDVVLCQQALQFFPDRVAALREMGRVASPGGRVALGILRSLDRHPVYAIFAEALGEHVGSDAAEMMGSPFALGAAEVLRASAREAGLREVTVQVSISEERFPSVADFVHWEAASSPLAAELARLDADQQASLVSRLEHDLSPYLDDLGLVFHNETHIVTATR